MARLFNENEGVRYHEKSYRYTSHPEVPEACYLTDAKGNRLLVYKSEIEESFSADVEIRTRHSASIRWFFRNDHLLASEAWGNLTGTVSA
jgi:hypothetical protein